MKNTLLFTLILCASTCVNAQNEMNLETSIGLPLGNSRTISSFKMTLGLNYLFKISPKLHLGPTIGYHYNNGKTVTESDETSTLIMTTGNLHYLPFAVATRYAVTDKIIIGTDLGTTLIFTPLETSCFNTSFFYYKVVSGYRLSNKTLLNLSYIGLSNEKNTLNTLHLGVTFKL